MTIYLLPNNPLKAYVGQGILGKFNEFFYQKWSFFANPGNVYLSLLVKCDDQDIWIDTSADILSKHQAFRMPFMGKLLYHQHSYGLIGNELINLRQKKEGKQFFYLEGKYAEMIHSFSESECKKRGYTFLSGESALIYRKIRKFSERKIENLFTSYEIVKI